MMMNGRNVCISYFLMLITLLILLFMPSSFHVEAAESLLDYPSFVDAPKIWNHTPDADIQGLGFTVYPILANEIFVCGLHCSNGGINCLFAISIIQNASISNGNGNYYDSVHPQVVWSANRNDPLNCFAWLELTSEGQLILKDIDDVLIWSTGTVGKSVSRLNLSAEGNLMLLDRTNNIVVWQSFEHPTDSLVHAQRLVLGRKLRSSVSPLNSSEGLYAFGILNDGYTAYIDSDPSQIYYKDDGGLLYRLESPDWYTAPLIRLESDGHLKEYEWISEEFKWVGKDLLDPDRCTYPTVCGKYGICFEGGCNCPDVLTESNTTYFRPIDLANIDLGCHAISPISCEPSLRHGFLQLPPGEYSQGIYSFTFSKTLNVEDCKEACLKNCSCKAALYTKGYCHFLSQVFSIKQTNSGAGDSAASDHNNSAFIKVSLSPNPKSKKHNTIVIVASTLVAAVCLFLICTLILLRYKKGFQEVEEDYLDDMLGMPTRFSYDELKNATMNFSNKLGEGGFGSVFHGILPLGSEVAVKHLVGFGPVNKSFIAEVQTIGSIHHCNLVTLVGFCAEKLNRLLVYEYMANGSLDRWIFNKNQDVSLGWHIRKKIILDIAKGLAYLHEECNQKIIHLDIKPQNILLDQNFNAKVSDFGLSKLIGKDQSHIFTCMRGTPGYMAPEWLTSSISEKVDVYSFGIVVLEILCGRRNFDGSQEEEDRHLVGVFKRKLEEGKVMELVDKCSEDMQTNAPEVVEMMKVAAWCLQTEYARRPSMSTVVKLFEGSVDVVSNMNEEILNGLSVETTETFGSTVLASMLSGPR